jgi:NAD(P)-dependent dehydrogenase (short-subunit alcohol dehydrogenase family)
VLGQAIVRGFAAEGARVLGVDVDAGDGTTHVQDLTVDGAGAAVVGRAVELWGGVDVLVNNAGWSEPGWFAEQTDRALWQRTIEVNLFSAIDCTQAAIAPMRAAGHGAIVFLSSDAAFGAVRQGIYGSTKAGLISLARTVAREHGRHGIRANVVAPGLVLPGAGPVGPSSVWARGADAMFTDAQVESVVRTQALRRRTEPADVANAVVWLSSETAARQVTGQVVAVGGGSSMP